MEFTKIKLRRDIQANWNRINPILSSGEIGIVTDSNKFKIGDGITSFVLLPFATYSVDELDTRLQNLQVQITEIGSAELKAKVEQNTNDIATIKNAGYLNSEEVNNIINQQGFAKDSRVTEVEEKVTSNTTAITDIQNANYVPKSQFAKINGNVITEGGEIEIKVGTDVDTELSETSTNPVQNKVITTKIKQVESAIPTDVATNARVTEIESKVTQNTNNITTIQNADYQSSEQVNAIVDGKGFAKDSRVTEVEGKVTENSTAITDIQNANYQTSEQVNNIIDSKNLSPKQSIEEKVGANITINYTPYKIYKCTDAFVTTLTINGQVGSETGEMLVYFHSGNTPTTITLDPSYKVMGDVSNVQPDVDYIISVKDGYAVLAPVTANSGGGGGSVSWNDVTDKPAIPNKTSELQNDSNFTTLAEVEGKNYQTSAQVEQAISAKGYTTLDEVAQQGYAKGTIPTNNNQLENGADYQTGAQVEQTITSKNYTTISEVEGKGYQNSEQVEVAINAKEYVPKSQFATINSQSITDGGNIEIQGGGGGSDIAVDNVLGLSENPVENQAITNEVLSIQQDIDILDRDLSNDELWKFTMDDGSVVEKRVKTTNNDINYLYFEDVSGTNDNWFSFDSPYFTPKIQYSYDKKTWNDFQKRTQVPISANGKVYLKGQNYRFSDSYSSNTFYFNNFVNIGGDITCLLEPNGGVKDLSSYGEYCFAGVFQGNGSSSSAIKDASKLVLPSEILNKNCYTSLFQYQENMIYPPVLPAKVIPDGAYKNLFEDCQKLKYPPVLPAKVIGNRGYMGIFGRCYGLEYLPPLMATEISDNGYSYIFQYLQIEEAPILQLKTITTKAIEGLFYDCQFLKKVEIMTTTWNSAYTKNWLGNVSPTGTITIPKELVVWDGTGAQPEGSIPLNSPDGIPSGWTIIRK